MRADSADRKRRAANIRKKRYRKKKQLKSAFYYLSYVRIFHAQQIISEVARIGLENPSVEGFAGEITLIAKLCETLVDNIGRNLLKN